MKVYVILLENKEFERCWDCNAGVHNDNDKIIGIFDDQNIAKLKLDECIQGKRSHQYQYHYYIKEYETNVLIE
jgi:hypothetical protein